MSQDELRVKGQIAMGAYNAQTMLAYDLRLPGAYEEGYIPSGRSQAAAKVATDGASADYQDSHRRIMWDSWFRRQSRADTREETLPRC